MSNVDLRVFKFGGASVKSAEGVKNLANIILSSQAPLVVVVSAMGKTTNALEQILSNYLSRDVEYLNNFTLLKDYHLQIVNQLYPSNNLIAIAEIEALFSELGKYLEQPIIGDYNFNYDQIVSFGEIISTRIVSSYLQSIGIHNKWIDARTILRTDSNYREGNINFEVSAELCGTAFQFNESHEIFITQGFIGGTSDGYTTTLGREGSDYTAAILANLLDAKSVTIWKDVEGVLNADPRIFPNTIKLNEVSFREAIELAYCGAQIIHPKTIKPLQNKQITLNVRSFLNPNANGTLVYQTDKHIAYPPILIVKPNQVLVSLTPHDFSFVIEDCLSKIFAILYKHRVKANLVQSSAISFSICVDDEKHFLPNAIEELSLEFAVRYNSNLKLITIRHFTDRAIEEHSRGKEFFLMQKTRGTVRIVYKEK